MKQNIKKELFKAKANDIGTLATSYKAIDLCGDGKFMASGVIITIQSLSGDIIVEPTCIVDGIGAESIAALKADIKRSYDFRLSCNTIKNMEV